jgi:uncharacterized membrane protein (DUF485 family)
MSERHTPTPPDANDRRNSRLGLWLFAVYCLAYGGFMVLAAFFPQVIATRPIDGINLAVHYGIFLIVAAFALALLYLVLCRGGKS